MRKKTAGSNRKICRRKNGRLRCNNICGDNKLEYCENHYKQFTDLLSQQTDKKKKMKNNYGPPKMKKKEKLPPDENRCTRNDGMQWRCKNFRMNFGAGDDSSVPNTKYCENHYFKSLECRRRYKKRSESSEDEGCSSTSTTGTQSRDSEDDGTENQPSSSPSDTSIETRNHSNCSKRRKRVMEEGAGCSTQTRDSKRKTEDDQSVASTSDTTDTTRDHLKRRKKVDRSVDETGIQPAASSDTCESDRKNVGGGSKNFRKKRKYVERPESSGDRESFAGIREPLVELESLAHYKSKSIELSVELEKKKLECNKLQGELADVETRKTVGTDETERTPQDATECRKKMFSDLESRVLRMEDANSTLGCVESRITRLERLLLSMNNKILTMEKSVESRISNLESLNRRMENETMKACVESRISNLESLLLRSSKQSSLSRCVKLQNSEKIKSEAWDWPKEVTESGENQRDETYRSKPNAESSNDRRKDSNVCELKTEKNNLNVYDVGVNGNHDSAMSISSGSLHISRVEERKGCSERPSQHGSSSHNHLGMSGKPFVNLVSDDDSESEDSDSSTDSGGSPGDLMKMMAMKYRNQNKDKEIKWKFEADMLSSFEEDPELCMKAVCALYRQQISGDETSAKGAFHYSDSLRATTLAKFLMDTACQGDPKKSVKELELLDTDAVDDCKRLARRYSKQLFSIYQSGKDPFFPPATSASQGNQTAK